MSTKTQQIDRKPFWGFKTVAELRFLSQVLNNKVQDVSLKKECFVDLLKGKNFSIELYIPRITNLRGFRILSIDSSTFGE